MAAAQSDPADDSIDRELDELLAQDGIVTGGDDEPAAPSSTTFLPSLFSLVTNLGAEGGRDAVRKYVEDPKGTFSQLAPFLGVNERFLAAIVTAFGDGAEKTPRREVLAYVEQKPEDARTWIGGLIALVLDWLEDLDEMSEFLAELDDLREKLNSFAMVLLPQLSLEIIEKYRPILVGLTGACKATTVDDPAEGGVVD